MRFSFRTVTAFGALLVTSSFAFAQAQFDGTWNVSRVGVGCTPAGQIQVTFKSGRVSGQYMGGSGNHIVAGSITGNGAFSFTGKSATDTVRFRGKIAGNSGSGNWNLEGRACSGTLTISK